MAGVTSRIFLVLLTGFGVALPGCDTDPKTTNSVAPSANEGHGHAEHAHPTEGPHHGVLVELGNENYHAEVVHDEAAGAVTVYLLDSAAKEPVLTEATEVVINVKQGDSPLQFKLPAVVAEGQTDGKASEFTLASKELVDALHDNTSSARLSITIDTKPYSGDIPHEDHADHGHDHEK